MSVPLSLRQSHGLYASTHALLCEIWRQVQGPAAVLEQAAFAGPGGLPSVFATTDLAAASVGAAGAAIAELTAARFGAAPAFSVDRRLASFWFSLSVRPQGWELPPIWDAVAGDYATKDGWIRLHTNAPHHRAAALGVLGVPVDRAQVAQAVATLGAAPASWPHA